MSEAESIASRFRRLRERAGLSVDDVAKLVGVSPWHIEIDDAEFSCTYSPNDTQRLSQVLGARAAALLGIETAESPISAADLVQRIHDECRSRGITLEQFEDAVGWRLSGCMEPPARLFKEMSLDGLQWLCRELRVDWQRVMLSL